MDHAPKNKTKKHEPAKKQKKIFVSLSEAKFV
jgi:hypothetical protein